MIKRTLVFSNPYHISCRLKQLVLSDKASGEQQQLPVEDLGYIIFDHEQITFTMSAMQELAANNVAVVFCNEKHLPGSMLFHFEGHHTQNERIRQQLNISEPLRKQLWQQTIKAKLRNQAAVLDRISENGDAIRRMAFKVASGDTNNREAVASRYYWRRLFGQDFKRDRYGFPPNNLLNYGYAILRAATARALVGSGLLPTIGIHHRNKYNAFCLADDIMEPYRPVIDYAVWHLNNNRVADKDITMEEKKTLIGLMTADVLSRGDKRPLTITLAATGSSLSQCFSGTRKKIIYPEFIIDKN